MANIKYFADLAGGTVLEFDRVDYRSRRDIRGYDRQSAQWVKVTRSVERKANPSRHQCDARCLNATGLVMKCECACGGKNHGRGAFVCAEAA